MVLKIYYQPFAFEFREKDRRSIFLIFFFQIWLKTLDGDILWVLNLNFLATILMIAYWKGPTFSFPEGSSNNHFTSFWS